MEETELPRTRKNDQRKILLGALLRQRTLASNGWIARRLCMGDPTRVSRYCGQAATLGQDPLRRKLRKLEMSICKD